MICAMAIVGVCSVIAKGIESRAVVGVKVDKKRVVSDEANG